MSNKSLSKSKIVLTVLCLSSFVDQSLCGYSCIQSPAKKWRLCKPVKQEIEGECRFEYHQKINSQSYKNIYNEYLYNNPLNRGTIIILDY